MIFEHPQALWFLLLLSIPILIHLFQFRRYKKMAFSNVAFLQQIRENKKQRSRLKHLLILLLRCLFIVFITLCLATPYLPSNGFTKRKELVILDKSPSMLQLAEGKNTSVLEEMMQELNNLAEKRKDFKPLLVDDMGKEFQFYENIKVNSSQTAIKFDQIFEKHPQADKIYLASDFQKSNFDEYLTVFSDTSKQFVLLPAFQEAPSSLVFDSVWTYNNNLKDRAELNIRAFHTSQENRSLQLELFLNDQLAGANNVDFENGGFSNISFSLTQIQAGSNALHLQLEEASFFDDQFYAVLENTEKLEVAYLFQNKENELISKLFSEEEFKLTLKLEENYNYQTLENYDLLIVEIPAEFSKAKLDGLKNYTLAGKTLILIPTERTQSLNNLSELGLQVDSGFKADTTYSLLPPDYDNPFFSGVFKEQDKSINMPQVQLDYNISAGDVLYEAANGLPFLLRKKQRGSIYIFSGPLDKGTKSFINSPLLLSTFYKMAYSEAQEKKVNYQYLDEEVISLPYIKLAANTLVRMVKEDQVLVPDQRNGINGLQILLPQNNVEPGIWELQDHKSKALLGKLGLNYPKSESTSGYYTTAELSEILKAQNNVEVLQSNALNGLESYVEKSKEGIPLWKYFLVLALLCLLMEVLVIRFVR